MKIIQSSTSGRRLTIGLCVAAMAAAVFAPASNNDPIQCFNVSSTWCGTMGTTNCDVMVWYYTMIKGIDYTCTGTKASHIGPVLYKQDTPCCSTLTTEPADPTTPCNPCPHIVN